MKRLLPFLFLLPYLAIAGSSNCYSIKDRDARSQCLAESKGQKSRCYQIENNDRKNLCLADTGNQKSYCYQIREKDTKALCLSKF